MADEYYVTIRDDASGNRRELKFITESFGQAEKLAEPFIQDMAEEIIQIQKDYKVS